MSAEVCNQATVSRRLLCLEIIIAAKGNPQLCHNKTSSSVSQTKKTQQQQRGENIMIVLDLPRGFDKVVTSCNILIPCNMLCWSVSLAMECTHSSHLSDRLLYLSYFQEIAVLLKSWFDAGLSGSNDYWRKARLD